MNERLTWLIQFGVMVLLHLIASFAWALPEDSQQPITIQADRGTFANDQGEANFFGNVFLQQGTLKVRSDRLKVVRDSDSGAITFLEATGTPARYEQVQQLNESPLQLEGLRIEYQPLTDTIISEGEAVLNQKTNQIKAYYIRYHLSEETLDVHSRNNEDGQASGNRPQAQWILQPETSQ